jgi:hypothetical protein
MKFTVKPKPKQIPTTGILAETEGWILGRGLSFQNKLEDQEYTQLPRDITKLASQQIGQMLNSFTQQSSFLEQEVSRVDVGHTLADTALDMYEKKFMLTAEGTLTEKKAKLAIDETYVQLMQEKLQWFSKLTMLKGMLRAAEKNYTAASREISRRGGDFERTNRGSNIR